MIGEGGVQPVKEFEETPLNKKNDGYDPLPILFFNDFPNSYELT